MARGSWVWSGAAVFAGTMLLIVGMINVFEGFIALLDDERVAMVRGNLVVVDLTGWGWVLLISGLLMVGAGAGLFARQTWARITAIVIASLHAIAQVGWISAYPVWSLLMIALDVIIIFALTARWSGVRDNFGGMEPGSWEDAREASEEADRAYRTGRPTPTA
jgi:hypothetical protein